MRDLSTVRKLKIDPSSSFDFRVGAMLKERGVLRCSKYFFSRFILRDGDTINLNEGERQIHLFFGIILRFVKQT